MVVVEAHLEEATPDNTPSCQQPVATAKNHMDHYYDIAELLTIQKNYLLTNILTCRET